MRSKHPSIEVVRKRVYIPSQARKGAGQMSVVASSFTSSNLEWKWKWKWKWDKAMPAPADQFARVAFKERNGDERVSRNGKWKDARS